MIRELQALGMWLQVDPLVLTPHYRPPGLWCYPDRLLGPQILFRFPPPCHPLEALAALRGWDGPILAIAEQRAVSWLEGTRMLAKFLGLTPGATRRWYHLLTPLNVGDDRLASARSMLWRRLGYDASALVLARGPLRLNFWEEVNEVA